MVSVLFHPVKPAIVDFQNVTGNDGDTPTIFCTSRGDPAPAMTFRKAENTENYVDGGNVCKNSHLLSLFLKLANIIDPSTLL